MSVATRHLGAPWRVVQIDLKAMPNASRSPASISNASKKDYLDIMPVEICEIIIYKAFKMHARIALELHLAIRSFIRVFPPTAIQRPLLWLFQDLQEDGHLLKPVHDQAAKDYRHHVRSILWISDHIAFNRDLTARKQSLQACEIQKVQLSSALSTVWDWMATLEERLDHRHSEWQCGNYDGPLLREADITAIYTSNALPDGKLMAMNIASSFHQVLGLYVVIDVGESTKEHPRDAVETMFPATDSVSGFPSQMLMAQNIASTFRYVLGPRMNITSERLADEH